MHDRSDGGGGCRFIPSWSQWCAKRLSQSSEPRSPPFQTLPLNPPPCLLAVCPHLDGFVVSIAELLPDKPAVPGRPCDAGPGGLRFPFQRTSCRHFAYIFCLFYCNLLVFRMFCREILIQHCPIFSTLRPLFNPAKPTCASCSSQCSTNAAPRSTPHTLAIFLKPLALNPYLIRQGPLPLFLPQAPPPPR